MKDKGIKKFLLYMENEENLNSEIANHGENCDECREYFNYLNDMKKKLGKKKEYSNEQIELALYNLKANNNLKDENMKYKPWMHNKRNIVIAGLLFAILILFIPINKTCIAMEILNLSKSKISISNNGREISMEVGNYKVDVKREYPEAYKLITERNRLIDEILTRKGEKEAYGEIDKIIETYNERLQEEDYKRINPKPKVYKYFKSMEALKAEIGLDKEINPTIPGMFQLNKITYSEDEANYKRVDLEYYDNKDENRINHEKRKLGITYVFKKQNEKQYSYSFQKGAKLKEISIGEYGGYILEQDEEKYSNHCVGVFMNDCEITVYSKSKLGDASENERMLIEIAKSIAY